MRVFRMALMWLQHAHFLTRGISQDNYYCFRYTSLQDGSDMESLMALKWLQHADLPGSDIAQGNIWCLQ